jgi:hypothetical protein
MASEPPAQSRPSLRIRVTRSHYSPRHIRDYSDMNFGVCDVRHRGAIRLAVSCPGYFSNDAHVQVLFVIFGIVTVTVIAVVLIQRFGAITANRDRCRMASMPPDTSRTILDASGATKQMDSLTSCFRRASESETDI